MMAKRPSWVLRVGTPVSWKYRGTRGYGYIKSVDKLGSDEAHTEYSIREVDHHVSDSGSKEPSVVGHFGSDIRREKRSTVEAHAKAAKKSAPLWRHPKIMGARLDRIEQMLDEIGVPPLHGR